MASSRFDTASPRLEDRPSSAPAPRRCGTDVRSGDERPERLVRLDAMGKGVAMSRWRTGLALLLLCGCTPTSRVIRAGDVPDPDEVVVIGRMSFVPEFRFRGTDHT